MRPAENFGWIGLKINATISFSPFRVNDL